MGWGVSYCCIQCISFKILWKRIFFKHAVWKHTHTPKHKHTPLHLSTCLVLMWAAMFEGSAVQMFAFSKIWRNQASHVVQQKLHLKSVLVSAVLWRNHCISVSLCYRKEECTDETLAFTTCPVRLSCSVVQCSSVHLSSVSLMIWGPAPFGDGLSL